VDLKFNKLKEFGHGGALHCLSACILVSDHAFVSLMFILCTGINVIILAVGSYLISSGD